MDPTPPAPLIDTSVSPANELYVSVKNIIKLYTDNTGRLPVSSRHGNQYIMIAYHYDYNAILQLPFYTKKDTQRIAAYSSIMKRLKARGHSVNLQILNNKASADYRCVIEEEWHAKFQLVPLDVHCRNVAERAI